MKSGFSKGRAGRVAGQPTVAAPTTSGADMEMSGDSGADADAGADALIDMLEVVQSDFALNLAKSRRSYALPIVALEDNIY